MKLSELVPLFLESLVTRRLSPATVSIHARWLAVFTEFCRAADVEDVTAVDSAVLAAFKRHVEWDPIAPGRFYGASSVQQLLRAVRTFFRWAAEHGRLLVDPTQGMVLGRVPRPLINLLTVAEVEALMNAPSPQTVLGLRDRAVLETLYGTGIRRAELVALDLTDVDMQSLTLLVKRGKNQRSRVLPVGDRLSHALKEYLLHGRPHLQARLAEPALFVGHRGQRLDKSAVDHVMRHHSRKAGFKRTVGAHSLRHAFAGHMLRNGADLRSLQAMLGHESLASTQQYTRIYLEDLQKEHRRTHPRSKRRSTWRPDGWL